MTAIIVLIACVISTVVSYLSARLAVIPLLQRSGVLDHPSARSSHDTPVARGGGIAVFAGVVVGTVSAMAVYTVSSGTVEPGVDLLRSILPIAAAVLFGLVGLIDDLNSLSAVSRLVTQLVLSVAFAVTVLFVTGVGAFAVAAVVLSIVLIVNGTNFMDGLNTLVPVWGIATALWFAVLAISMEHKPLTVTAIALAGALVGFLPLNATPARAFLGDVGSYAIGGFFSVGIWVLWSEGAPLTALFAPFVIPLFDVLYTLGRRMYGGENLFTAHRTHIYQRLQSAGLTHEQVSAIHVGAVVLCIIAALPTVVSLAWYGPPITLALWAGLIGGYMYLPPFVIRRGKLTQP